MSSKKALDADNQQAIENKVSNEYLSGFVDGEGCFYVGFGKREDLPLKWQIITEFHLSQNPGGKNVLEEFSRRLGCGYLKPHELPIKDIQKKFYCLKSLRDYTQDPIPLDNLSNGTGKI